MEKIELSNGKSIQCKILTKEEYQKKIEYNNGKLMPEYKNEYSIDVFRTSINEILVHDEGYYTLYYGIDDLDKVLKDANNHENGIEVLFNKNPYASNFPHQTKKLINDLCLSIKVEPNTTLDIEYLKKIESKINLMKNPQSFYEQNFLNIIALIGEAIVQTDQAKWDMKLSGDNHTWNPYLKVRNESLDFFTNLYEDIFLNNQTKNAISEVYQTAIGIIHHNVK